MESVQSKGVAYRHRRRANKGNMLSDERRKKNVVIPRQRQTRQKHAKRGTVKRLGLLLCVVSNNNRENNGDNSKDDECKDEANPSFFSCGASRGNSFIRVANSGA